MDNSNRISFESFYKHSERRRRISIDIDSVRNDNLKVQRVFFNLGYIFDKAPTVDKTRHGFHVKVVDERIEKIPIEKRIVIRERMEDDSMRVDLDKLKLKAGLYFLVDTLFSMKRGRDGKLFIVEQINPIALPWISRLPAKKH